MRRKKRERLATAVLWGMAAACGSYILWKINPEPIEQTAGWLQIKTGQVLTRGMGTLLAHELPALSCSFLESPETDGKEGAQEEHPEMPDPSYSRYLALLSPGDG